MSLIPPRESASKQTKQARQIVACIRLENTHAAGGVPSNLRHMTGSLDSRHHGRNGLNRCVGGRHRRDSTPRVALLAGNSKIGDCGAQRVDGFVPYLTCLPSTLTLYLLPFHTRLSGMLPYCMLLSRR